MFDIVTHLPHRGLEDWKWSDLKSTVEAQKPDDLSQPMQVDIAARDGLTVTHTEPTDGLDAMTNMAAILSSGTLTVRVPDGVRHVQPLKLTDLRSGNAQIVIEIGKDASLSVEEHHSADAGFVNLDVRYIVREGASLTRSVVTQDGADVIRHVRASVTLWAEATFKQTQLTFGSALTRLETRVVCMGKVDVEMSGAYLLSGTRHADITNYIDFATPGSTVRDAVAGVVTDKARGVFQGKFYVRRPAQQTDAVMRHDALMLSDTAKINAKPELEIYADDVLCEHGNTIGQLDEQAMFYMRQRGIPKAQARALLIEAFVVARLGEDEAMVSIVRDWLDAQS
jgi:Fe-S cluster assembly protein SufD